MGKAARRAKAKAWLRTLQRDQVLTRTAALTMGVMRGKNQLALSLRPPLPPAPAEACDARRMPTPYC